MRKAQKVLSAFDRDKFRIGRIDEQLDLVLCVGHRVDHVVGSLDTEGHCGQHKGVLAKGETTGREKGGKEGSYMEPQDRTSNVKEAAVQPIAFPEVDGSHSRTSSAVVALVVRLDGLFPVVADVAGAVFAEADVDEEVAEGVVGFEVGRRFVGRPVVDVGCEFGGAVPAMERAGTFGFVVERGA